MPDEKGRETEEEARDRVAQVRATQIFGDTPTDPTIGDIVVPTHDEEAAGGNLAAANADAEDVEDEDRDDLLSDAEVKRQGDTPQFEAAAQDLADREDADADDSADQADADDLSREEKIERIKSASSVEEVDSLAAGDERKTVKDAAEARKAELA